VAVEGKADRGSDHKEMPEAATITERREGMKVICTKCGGIMVMTDVYRDGERIVRFTCRKCGNVEEY
jgi:predicted RNA-binding Zn-ribbon protein involved in translation (DUF1610 family)